MKADEKERFDSFRADRSDDLRDHSGKVVSSDPWVTFMYLLLRDRLPAGVVAELLNDTLFTTAATEAVFTNGYLANYAKYIVEKMNETRFTSERDSDTSQPKEIEDAPPRS